MSNLEIVNYMQFSRRKDMIKNVILKNAATYNTQGFRSLEKLEKLILFMGATDQEKQLFRR